MNFYKTTNNFMILIKEGIFLNKKAFPKPIDTFFKVASNLLRHFHLL